MAALTGALTAAAAFSLSKCKSRFAETKPHQSLPFIAMSSAAPTAYAFSTHQPKTTMGLP